MKKLTFVLLCLVMGITLATAQTSQVTGIVISAEDGEPIIGASVVAKGTTTGTVTDFDGKFSLTIPSSAKTLVFSYVGMAPKEEAVKSQLRVTLSSSMQNLDEVVVTAMGISREKKALGYAVQDVKSEQLNQASNSNLAGALQGKVSGMDIKPSSGMPGASSQITIRGARSFTGDNTPLYVVDGMPISSTSDVSTLSSVTGGDYSNRAVDIDPNDIESINILKGQAASALYGIRASNGVIVITTKSGKGTAKGKPQITFSSNVSIDQISRYPQRQMTYAQGSEGKFGPGASTSWGPKISELPNDPTYGGNTVNEFTNKYGMQTGKYYVTQRANAGLDPWATPQSYDNIEEFFNTGVTWNNSLNVSQATEKTSYSFSLGSSTQDGIIPTTGMDRYNAKAAVETKLHHNWTTGFNANYVNTSIKKMPTANDGILATVYPAAPNYDLAGIPSHFKDDPYTQNTYRGTSGFASAYWMLDNTDFTEKTSRFFGNAYANYKTKFNTTNHTLNVKYQFGTDAYTTHYADVWGYGHKGSNKNGQLENSGWSNVTLNSLLTANYDWNINENWTINALLGNELVQDNRKYYYEYGAGFNFPGWNHVQNATTKDAREKQTTKRTVGFFGSLSASYRNMLYLNVTGRNDYVSNMPTGNRSFFYPSVSAGFILTELDGLKEMSVLSFAKLRASYAEVGQAGDYSNNYFYTPEYGSGFYSTTPLMYPINGVNGFTPYYTVFDPNLKPQNTQSYELGFDTNFFNNLFGISYTYARQNVTDQIFEVPLAGSTGSSNLLTNGGRMHTNSHEITLTVNPIRTKNVDWNMAFNWSKIDNYVDELAEGVESIMLGGFVTPQVRAGKKDKFPVIYGTGYLKNEQGQLIVDEDGLPQAGEAMVIGDVSPDFRLGFNTSVRLYKFTVSAVLDWKQGGQMYSGTNGLMDFYGTSKLSGDREGSFIVEGVKADGSKNDIQLSGAIDTEAYYSAINNIDEASIYNNSFLKLRELAVSYQVLNKSWMDLTVNVFARNLLLWSEYPNFDPESSQGNTNMAGAFERFSMPATSSYGLGFTVKF